MRRLTTDPIGELIEAAKAIVNRDYDFGKSHNEAAIRLHVAIAAVEQMRRETKRLNTHPHWVDDKWTRCYIASEATPFLDLLLGERI